MALWASCNSKGGTGKTTLTCHLAVLAQERGLSVGVIDADVLEGSTNWLAGMKGAPPVTRLRTADDLLDRALEVAAAYDLCLADGPGGSGELSRALLMVCDLALVPCGPTATDWRATQDTLRLIQQARRIRKGAPDALLVPNRLQAGTRLSREFLAALHGDGQGIPAVDGLSLRTAFADADGQHSVVWRLPNAKAATDEIFRLYEQIHGHQART